MDNKCTLEQIILRLQPSEWGSKVNFEKWFEWPPDIFLMTSAILNITGSYTNVVSPPIGCSWEKEGWRENSRKKSDQWTYWIIKKSRKGEHPLADYMKILSSKNFLQRDIYEFYEPSENIWEVLKAILELHCISDESFRGIGVLYPKDSNFSPLFVQAQYLLVLRGTISRINKHHGIVIPKLRTPKVGITLRSLSHYLTFHDTEVDIGWYSGPWINIDENKVNILIVPWPYNIRPKDFTYEKYGGGEARSNYFYYRPSENGFSDELDRLISQIKHLMSTTLNKVHILAFPEMSLRLSELEALKSALVEEFEPYDIPMIIAGVSDRYGDYENQDKSQHTSNRVILSGYYSLKWFDIIQNKHHRWRIDRKQAANYQIDGVLSGKDEWWESIFIPQRKINFFAPNAWLTICPLICEDLARLEPVSEIIRGVGPTLITALLLDGPQIKERWPARYATIFADDPGSSVLTLTALGFVKRSNDGFRLNEGISVENEIIASWKDEIKGYRQIDSKNSSKSNNILLSVEGEWGEEYTADNRLDDEITAQLVLKNVYESDFDVIRKKTNENLKNVASDLDGKKTFNREKFKQIRDRSLKDITELSLANYAIDLSIDVDDNRSISIIKDLCMDLGFSRGSRYYVELESKRLGNSGFIPAASLLDLINESCRSKSNFPTPHYLYSVRTGLMDIAKINTEFRKIRNDYKEEVDQRLAKYQLIFDRCEASLDATLERIVIMTGNSKKEELDSHLRNVNQLLAIFSRRIKKVCQEYVRLHSLNNTKPDRRTIKSFDLSELSRIHIALPITLLLSLHKRFSYIRRSQEGGLNEKQNVLMVKIEERLKNLKVKDTWKERREKLKQIKFVDDIEIPD